MSRLFKKAMDPISSETHFVAACFSLVGLFIIFGLGAYKGTPLSLMGAVIVFGLSQIALYSASSLYHYYQGSEKIKFILRKLDHAMIYVLIVGTYTPIIVYCMEAPKSYYFLGVLWALAIVGILVKVFWMNAPRILGTSIYLILGWSIPSLSPVQAESLLAIISHVIPFVPITRRFFSAATLGSPRLIWIPNLILR